MKAKAVLLIILLLILGGIVVYILGKEEYVRPAKIEPVTIPPVHQITPPNSNYQDYFDGKG